MDTAQRLAELHEESKAAIGAPNMTETVARIQAERMKLLRGETQTVEPKATVTVRRSRMFIHRFQQVPKLFFGKGQPCPVR
jgi:hypothetical protein